MGRMKTIYLELIQDPAIQTLIELHELRGCPHEPEIPDPAWIDSTEPLEGTVFDPESFVPF